MLVTEDGLVENRVIEVPLGLPPSALVSAGNYLNARLVGRTIEEARADIEDEIGSHKAQLDELTSRVVSTGLASWAGGDDESALIVRGQANLLEDVTALADLERLRSLFEMLETKETVLRLLDASKQGRGGADLYRRRKPSVRRRRLFADHRAVSEQPRADRRRDRGHRPHADQLCPDHPDGGLHRQDDRPAHRMKDMIEDKDAEQRGRRRQ